jgi:MFS family permease
MRRARDESAAAVTARADTRALVPYFLLSAVLSLGYGSVVTLLAEIRDRFDLTNTEVGFIGGAGFLAGFVAQIGLARYADRGHAARMVRIGITLAIVGVIMCVFATDLWQWILARIALGLGSGMVSPATRRVVIARDPDRVGANLGMQGAFDITGFVVGPVLAGVLAEVVGFRSPFVVLAFVYFGLFALVARLDLSAGAVSGARRSVRALLRRPPMQAALFASIAFYITVGMWEAVMSPLLSDLGAEVWLIGVSFSLFTVPMIVLAPKGGRLAQRRGPMNVVVFSIFGATICTFLYGFVPLWLLLVVSLVHACADSFTMPGNQIAVAISSPPDQLAAGQGLLGSVGLLVAGAMGLIGGALYDHAGRAWLFTLTAAGMVVFLVLARWRANVAERQLVSVQ